MFGIGPMLPVIPAAEKGDCSTKKVRKRKSKHNPDAESHELTIMRRPSTIKTESTLFEDTDSDEYAVKEPASTPHRQRDLSLIVDFDLEHAAAQLKSGEISDLELALFAFWIKAEHDNYVMARELVRELALDQGYNVGKITNPRVRRLLQEVHDVRPRSVPRRSPPPSLAAPDGLHHDQTKDSIEVPALVTTRRRVWFAAAGDISKTRSNNLTSRDPRHASTWESPFHNLTRNSNLRMCGSTRAVSSPLTARMDTLPPSLRIRRELAVQEAARPTMTSRDDADYPPNTPDRPAPLSVKSRGSQISNSTPMPSSTLRSVSMPIRTKPKDEMKPVPQRNSTVKVGDTEALALPSFTAAKDSCRSTGDVFGTAHSTNQGHHDPFTDSLQSSEDRRQGTPGEYMYKNTGGHGLGPYQLNASDIASESSYGTFTSIVRKNMDRISTSTSFDALESYVGTEDEDEGSILEPISNISEEESPMQYQFAAQIPPSQPVIVGPVPRSSECRSAAKALRKSQAPGLSSQGLNFHRPLPLRSYESEATMFPTAGAQANSGHNRSKSVTSTIASRRPATGIMALPSLAGSIQTRNSLNDIEREFYERNNSHTKISEQVDRDVTSVLQRSSSVSTLSAFPIPPMDNPVGELPMLVSRAASSPQSLRTTSSLHPVAFASPEDTYRAIIKVNMVAVLQRTRVRGEGLQAVDWDKLTSFERAWREMNELLLVTIYGRNDVILDETDVTYIDCIARELRNDSGDVESSDWVRHMFKTYA